MYVNLVNRTENKNHFEWAAKIFSEWSRAACFKLERATCDAAFGTMLCITSFKIININSILFHFFISSLLLCTSIRNRCRLFSCIQNISFHSYPRHKSQTANYWCHQHRLELSERGKKKDRQRHRAPVRQCGARARPWNHRNEVLCVPFMIYLYVFCVSPPLSHNINSIFHFFFFHSIQKFNFLFSFFVFICDSSSDFKVQVQLHDCMMFTSWSWNRNKRKWQQKICFAAKIFHLLLWDRTT